MEVSDHMRVLILEDDVIQNNNLKSLIKMSYPDINVFQSYCLKDAFQIINQSEIDLFLIDINLPDGSGVELAKKIRNIPEHNLTGIVIITSNSNNILETFKDIHCYDFLVKPYNSEEVNNIIQTFRNKCTIEENIDNKYTIIPVEYGVNFKLYHKDIVFIEYVSRGCIIHTIKNKIICKNLPLSKILKDVDSSSIVQSHKSYIVNVNYILKIEKGYQKMWHIYFNKIDAVAELSAKYKETVLGKWGIKE